MSSIRSSTFSESYGLRLTLSAWRTSDLISSSLSTTSTLPFSQAMCSAVRWRCSRNVNTRHDHCSLLSIKCSGHDSLGGGNDNHTSPMCGMRGETETDNCWKFSLFTWYSNISDNAEWEMTFNHEVSLKHNSRSLLQTKMSLSTRPVVSHYHYARPPRRRNAIVQYYSHSPTELRRWRIKTE